MDCVVSDLREKSDSGLGGALPAIRLAQVRWDTTPETVWQFAGRDFLELQHVDEAMACLQSGLETLPRSKQVIPWTLSIPALTSNGFAIDILCQNGSVRAWFGGLEEDFFSLPTAIHWVARALSNTYQLRTISVGGTPREWLLEPIGGSKQSAAILACGQPTLLGAFRTKSETCRSNPFVT